MNIVKLFFCLGVVAFVSGCAVEPQTLGISPKTWQSYSATKQEQISQDNYAVKKKKANEKPAPITNNWLQVEVKNGLVMMPPFKKRYHYTPVALQIQEGTCKQALLATYRKTHDVTLGLCYKNNILFLDPSRYEPDKADGSIRLYVSPLWRNGFTYNNVNTTGYAQLHNATITVKQTVKNN